MEGRDTPQELPKQGKAGWGREEGESPHTQSPESALKKETKKQNSMAATWPGSSAAEDRGGSGCDVTADHWNLPQDVISNWVSHQTCTGLLFMIYAEEML